MAQQGVGLQRRPIRGSYPGTSPERDRSVIEGAEPFANPRIMGYPSPTTVSDCSRTHYSIV